jgi:hypothetical protein
MKMRETGTRYLSNFLRAAASFSGSMYMTELATSDTQSSGFLVSTTRGFVIFSIGSKSIAVACTSVNLCRPLVRHPKISPAVREEEPRRSRQVVCLYIPWSWMQVTEAHSLIQGPRRLGDRRHDKDDKAGPFRYPDRHRPNFDPATVDMDMISSKTQIRFGRSGIRIDR